MVNPVHLRTLIEAVTHKSFTTAAARLGYTASAVSQQMASLERDTGTVLFTRSARSIEPTPAALTMVRYARRVLTDIDALLAASAAAELGVDGKPVQELRLGIFPSLATYVLPRMLGSKDWDSLGVRLQLIVGEPAQTIQGLRSDGELDLALVFQVGPAGLSWPSSLNRQWIGDDHFRVVLPRSWGITDGAEVTAEQLADMPWIMHHPGFADATLISRLFSALNLHPRVVAYCDDFNASLHLAAAGLGAALVPDLAMEQAPEAVVVVDVPEIRLARSIFSLEPGDRSNPQARVFMDRLAVLLAEPRLSRPR